MAKLAENYIRKGRELCVEGKIQTRSWEKEGIKRYTTEIYADNITLLGKKPEQTEPLSTVISAPAAAAADGVQVPPPAEDDLPF